MLDINWFVVIGCSVIPMIIGALWYSQMLFGNVWLKASGVTLAEAQKTNMAKVSILLLIMGALVSMSMLVWTVHQMSVLSIFSGEADTKLLEDKSSALHLYVKDFMDKYGKNFRTFKHGAFHGTLGGLFLALPIIGMSAIFERRGWKYIAIHTGFWIVCFAIIGGIICQWA